MKQSVEQIDKIIHEALSQEEAAFYDQLGEQSFLEMSLGVFKGRNKVIYIITVVMSLVLFGIFVYCAVLFFQAETTRNMLIYAAIGFWCMMGVMGIKLWYWLQMNTNSMLREMKRMELQVTTLSSKLDK